MTHQAEPTKGMKCVPAACFTLASLAAVAGISLGMFMGINDDHTLTPVHAHINLIGWVSMFLFGAYYNMFPHTVGLLAKIQVTLVAIGYVVAFGALAVMREKFATVHDYRVCDGLGRIFAVLCRCLSRGIEIDLINPCRLALPLKRRRTIHIVASDAG
jgi:hypothetical protein